MDKFKSYSVSEESAAPQTLAPETKPEDISLTQGDIAVDQQKVTPKTMRPAETSKPLPESDRIFVSPFARKTADEMGISLQEIQGTGPRGRIIHADVEARASMMKSKPSVATDGFTDIPLSNIRKVMVGYSSLPFVWLYFQILIVPLGSS